MSVMTDESLAFSVAEVTMQEFLAAVMVAAREPASAATARLQPARPLIEYPVARRPAFRPTQVRTTTPCRSAATGKNAEPVSPSRVAGARAAYWMLLAGALAVFVLS
jgi:hypothetical protein